MGLLGIVLLTLTMMTADTMHCGRRSQLDRHQVSHDRLGAIALKAFHDLLESQQIKIAFHHGLVRLWNELDFQQPPQTRDLQKVQGSFLLFGLSLGASTQVVGHRKLSEDCLWPLAKSNLSDVEAHYLESSHIYEVANLGATALVPGVLNKKSILTIPLDSLEESGADPSSIDFLYIEGGDLLQTEVLRRLFGDQRVFFSTTDPFLDDSLLRFVVYLEELHHLLDLGLRHPVIASEIYSGLDFMERLALKPSQSSLERELLLFKNSSRYEALVNAEIEKLKADDPYPQLYPELIPIWKKKIALKIERAFWQQTDLYFSYLLKYHESLAKWRVIQTLKAIGLDEEAAVELMEKSMIDQLFVSERLHRYFQDLYRRQNPPTSRSELTLKAMESYAWPEPFRQLVARLTMAEPLAKIRDLNISYASIDKRQMWLAPTSDQAYQVYLQLQSNGDLPKPRDRLKAMPILPEPSLDRHHFH